MEILSPVLLLQSWGGARGGGGGEGAKSHKVIKDSSVTENNICIHF